ncbi:probable phosphatase 2C 26 isoform X1 [Olea europaea subsp. europaea]|uniref:Protein phosphatase n=1 Tax=Olea europaea subsp. europaea TaxID=158383 RepID=A0A8S0PJH4_OLEEU|nr:probable phosphatase 2C 26 isoform X1 [Olea europaea subsp. europaea]
MESPLFKLCSSISCTKTFLQPISTVNSPKLHSINKRKKLVCSAPSDSNSVCSGGGVFLSIGTHLIPHPNKVEKGGEDAFFISSYKGGVIAVADGVSGWAERDVNPALFSRELMAHASNLVEDEEVQYDPRTLIKKAHAATSSTGSATAIVAMLERNGTMKIANVGDCGLHVVRKGQIVFSTSPQEHYFDCPYQLSSEAVGQTYLDATVTTVEIMEGDTVVMGSDGLFDNVFAREIISVVGSYNNSADAAKALANLAYDHSQNSKFDSPYSQEARARDFDVPWWKKIMGMKLTGMK